MLFGCVPVGCVVHVYDSGTQTLVTVSPDVTVRIVRKCVPCRIPPVKMVGTLLECSGCIRLTRMTSNSST